MSKISLYSQEISITGVILAGGLARRMNHQDKALIHLASKSLFRHSYDILEPQVDSLLINANRNQNIYKDLGYQLIEDTISGYVGPLAGIAAALSSISTSHLLTVPCDSPFLPDFLAQRFKQAYQQSGAEICVADDGHRLQPVFALIRKDTLASILDYLAKGERKIDRWYQKHTLKKVDFSDCPETFININTPDDLRKAEAYYDSK